MSLDRAPGYFEKHFCAANFSRRQIFLAGKFSLALSLKHGGDHMISRSKLSKKARRELDNKKRVTWDFSPVSRVKQSKKVYNRKRLRKTDNA